MTILQHRSELAFSITLKQDVSNLNSIAQIKKAVVEMFWICALKDISWSKLTPGFLAVVLESSPPGERFLNLKVEQATFLLW